MHQEVCLEVARRHEDAIIVEDVLNLEAQRRGFLSFVFNISNEVRNDLASKDRNFT
jgi:hypothetical protein